MTQLIVEFDELPPSPNRTRESTHWAARAGLDKRWRDWALLVARQAKNEMTPALRATLPWPMVTLSVTFYLPDRTRRDPGNLVGSEALKAAIDGIVDAGVIVDDNTDVIAVYGPFVFEHRKGKPGMKIALTAV